MERIDEITLRRGDQTRTRMRQTTWPPCNFAASSHDYCQNSVHFLFVRIRYPWISSITRAKHSDSTAWLSLPTIGWRCNDNSCTSVIFDFLFLLSFKSWGIKTRLVLGHGLGTCSQVRNREAVSHLLVDRRVVKHDMLSTVFTIRVMFISIGLDTDVLKRGSKPNACFTRRLHFS